MSFGGGGDGGARKAAQQEEAKKQAARNKLNALFGIAPDATALAAEKAPSSPVLTPAPPQRPAAPTDRGGPMAAFPGANVDVFGKPLNAPVKKVAPAPVAAPVDPLIGRVAEADKNKAARDADYQKIFDDVLGLNQEQIKQQHDVAARKNRFELFRRGLATGSVDADQSELLQDRNTKALLDATSRADTARTGARSTDESARLQLLSQISGGLDVGSATSSAVRGMDIARQNAYDTSKGNLIEGAFDDAGLIYQDQQNAGAIKRGRELYQKLAGATTPGSTAYAGRLG